MHDVENSHRDFILCCETVIRTFIMFGLEKLDEFLCQSTQLLETQGCCLWRLHIKIMSYTYKLLPS